uniref:Uncharacterized protein n=1 Tax=Wolbachia endosymbiont of Oeneis ivallda TaxID=3171168 RepID=A0AAU7YL33_9RICK
MPKCEYLTQEQKELYGKLKTAIEKQEDISSILKEASQKDLLAVLTTPNIEIKYSNGAKRTLTPLGYTIYLNNTEKEIKAILDVAKENNMLEQVLTTPNIEIKCSDGIERTLTPLGYAIGFINNSEKKKAILDVAKENNMLEQVLTTPNIEIKCSNGAKRTLTPLGYTIYLNNTEKEVKAILDVAKENNMLEQVLTTPNIEVKCSDGTKRTLTLLGYAIYLNNTEKEIKAILDVAKENNMLEQVLTTPNIEIKFLNDEERTLTPLGYAISFINNSEEKKAILDVAKENNMLEQVLTTPNIEIKYSNGAKRTLTLLGYAIYLNNTEKEIKAILDVAKENNMLEQVLTTPNIEVKCSDGTKRTLTPLGYAIGFINNSEKKKVILDVAKQGKRVLKEVSVGIEEHDRERLKNILETLKNQGQDEEQKTKIDDWLEILAKNVSSSHKSDKQPLAPESSIPKAEENIANNEGNNGAVKIKCNKFKIGNSGQKDTVKTTNKSIMIGSVCGAIALLAVGGGCFAAGVALPMLALIGIAVSAALVIGAIAGGISHVVLRPSDDECLSKPQKSVINSPKSQNKVQSQISDQEPKITIPQHLAEENLKESVSKADTNVKLTENSFKPNVVQQNTKPESYFKFNDNKLLFFTTNKNYKVLEEEYKNEDGNGKVIPGEFRIFVECESEKFCITGPYSSCQDVDDGKKSVFITSVRKQNAKGTVSKDPWEMMYKVGLNENKKLVEITEISRKPFEAITPNLNATTAQQTVNNTTIDQPTSSAVTNEHKETLVNAHEEKDEHNNAASNRKVQPVAEVKTLMGDLLSEVSAQDSDKVEKTPISRRSEEEEFYDAEDKQLSSITSDNDTLEFQDAITQPCLITSDMVGEQVETQNTVSRVLNKPQGNNIVIPEEAKLKYFPELSNFLSKASLEREKLFWKVVPNSSLFQPREERLAINCQSIDAQ